jgi:hypothetical protein
VGGGILEHLVEARAGDLLAAGAAIRRSADLPKPIRQAVTGRLQLADPGDPPDRLAERWRRIIELEVLGVGGQLTLEAGDLGPQGAPRRQLVALAGQGRIAELIDAPRGRRRVVDLAAGVKGLGQVARLDAVRSRPLGRLCRKLFEEGLGGRPVSHEGAGAVPGDGQPLRLEATVDRARGVDVDVGASG